MRTSVLQEIIAGIDALPGDTDTKAKAKNLVRSIGRQHGVKAVEFSDRRDFIQGMLANRVSRATAVQRLMARFEISRAQANRDYEKYSRLSHHSHTDATTQAFNGMHGTSSCG